jgi:Double-GTPase 2
MGLLRRLLWWRNRYPSWSFWLGLVITILLAGVIFYVVLAAVCVDLVKLISRWIRERLQSGARRRRLPGAAAQPPPAYRAPPPANPGPPVGSPPGRDGRADLPADRRVRILVLGFPGCGKTIMLAGLYYYFAQGGPIGIRLSTDHESNGRLLSLVAQIRTTPGGYFPPGTSVTETRVWSFTVKVESEHQDADAFTLEYLDYAGRLVEELAGARTDDPPDEEFRRAVDSADVLMGVIDGEQLMKLMSGGYDPEVVDRIDRLLNVLIRARRRNIHLVVSKWDLLVRGDGGRYTMADVRRTLAAMSPAFSNFQRNPRLGKLRMIPVAALGMNGFAVPAGAGGGMTRNPGVEWSPWNAEIPFFCAVPDIIRYDVDRMAAAAGTPGQANLPRSIARITLAVLASSGLTAKVGVPGFTLDFPISEAVQRIRQHGEDRYARSRVPPSLDEGTAIGYVVNECYGSVDEFERRWPDSRLSTRGAW